VLAPVTPKVAGPNPLQTLADVTVKTGKEFTVIVPVAVAVHVWAFVPFTVYTVVFAGLSVGLVALLPVMPPPVHVYVLAPVTPNVPTCCPTHIVLLVTAKTGSAFTVTVVVPLVVQVPAAPIIV
jgi:hypothetical protein